MIPVEDIQEDPNFENVRLQASKETLAQLTESMNLEGLKVPIILIERGDHFCVRAGFRRLCAALSLGWERIPAIVLPSDTPEIEEHWTCIIENSSRDKLSTYEIACAASGMRERFGVSARDFARRAGYSESYVHNLLRCLDRLPDEIKEEWRRQAPIPMETYLKWTNLNKEEAVREMLVYCGRHPQVVGEWKPSPNLRKKTNPARTATTVGLSRMQRLRAAVESVKDLDEKTRSLCLQVIDYCSGGRDDVSGIYDSRRRDRRKKEKEEETE